MTINENESTESSEGSSESITPDQPLEESSENDSNDLDHGSLNEMLGISQKEGVVDNSGKKSSKAQQSDAKDNDVAKLLEELGAEPEEIDPEELVDSEGKKDFELKVDGKVQKFSLDELKNFASKGFDYTKKTQEVASQRAELQGFKSKMELEYKEHQNKITEARNQFQNELKLKEQFDFCLDNIKQEDPVFYEELQNKLQSSIKHYSNPVVEKLMKEVESLKGIHQNNEMAAIKNQYQNDWSSAKTNIVPQIEKLGIKVDEEAVKQAWIKSGDMKAAIFSVYGNDLNKLYTSKVKVDSAKNKIKTTNKVVARSPISNDVDVATVKERGGYGSITNKLLGLSGKR